MARARARLLCLSLAWLLTVAGCVAPRVSATKDIDRSATADTSMPTRSLKQDPVYVVQPGDTLVKIALWTTGNSGNWRAIARHNDIADPSRLRIKQRLRIPAALLEASLQATPQPVRPPSDEATRPADHPAATATPVAQASPPPLPVPTPKTQAPERPTQKGQGPVPALARAATPAVQSQVHAAPAAQPPDPARGWILVTGSYYPREVKAEPDRGADSLMLVWPGTRLRYMDHQGIWYRVLTDKGEGYVDQDYAQEQ